MKILNLITIFILTCLSCSDDSTTTDTQDAGRDSGMDIVDVSKMDTPKVDLNRSSFPDPDRESKAPCEKNIDCARGTTCNSLFELCAMTVGCALFGGPRPDETRGCLIGRDGQSRFTEKECDEDSDCPSQYPICIFKACQAFSRCEMDSDCEPKETCQENAWCQEI